MQKSLVTTATISKGSGLKLRTFVALTLPQETKQFLSDCVSYLKRSGIEGSFVKLSNFHLTLKFLGDTEENIIPQIIAKLDQLNLRSMPIKFTGSGVFPKMASPRVVWYGVDADGLGDLAGQIDSITNTFGFDKEDKPFVGHLTLVRIKDSKPKNLAQVLESLPKPPKDQNFISLEFIKSELNPSGSIYTPLWQRKLEGDN